MNATRDFLFNVAIPARTDSYSPVSHSNIINAAYEQLDRHNLVVTNEFSILIEMVEKLLED